MVNILDQLKALRAFEAVARLGSVKDASAELNVTHGAISKQLRNLERIIGSDLFIREHRAMQLVGEAAPFAKTLTEAFRVISRSSTDLQRSLKPEGITIAAPNTFLIRWLLPRLAQLEARIGGKQVNLVRWNRNLAVSDRSVDILIAVGKEKDTPGVTREWLASETFGPVVRSGSQFDLMSTRRLDTRWPVSMWRSWSEETGNRTTSESVLEFESLLFAIQGAEAGLGVAVAPGPSVWDAVNKGILFAPLGFQEREGSWEMLWRTNRTSGTHTKILNWLRSEFETSKTSAEKAE